MPKDVKTPQPSAADIAAAKEITIAANMSAQRRKARIGSTGKALRKHLFDAGGDLRFWPDITIIRNYDGQPVGFAVDDVRVDYSKPWTLPSQAGVTAWQGPSRSLDRSLRRTAEKRLLAAFCDAGGNWFASLNAINLDPIAPGIGLRSMVANILIDQMIANAVDDDLDGRLALVRMCPPTLRAKLSAMTMADTDAARFAADLIYDVPIVMLWPRKVGNLIGQKRTMVLDALGLSKQGRRIKFGAVGALAYRLNTDAFDALDGELDWLTEALCKTLPDHVAKQRAIVDLAALLALCGKGAGEIECVAFWYSKCLGARPYTREEDGREARELICAYIVAGTELTDAVGVDPWSERFSWERFSDNLDHFAERLEKRRSGNKTPFPVPRWIPKDGKLPQSQWNLTRLTCEQDLITEGHEMRHCVGGYASACRSGSVIYTIRRDPFSTDSQKRIRRGKYLGGTLQLVERGGFIQIAQIYGPLNTDVPSSLRAAVWRMVDEVNALRMVEIEGKAA